MDFVGKNQPNTTIVGSGSSGGNNGDDPFQQLSQYKYASYYAVAWGKCFEEDLLYARPNTRCRAQHVSHGESVSSTAALISGHSTTCNDYNMANKALNLRCNAKSEATGATVEDDAIATIVVLDTDGATCWQQPPHSSNVVFCNMTGSTEVSAGVIMACASNADYGFESGDGSLESGVAPSSLQGPFNLLAEMEESTATGCSRLLQPTNATTSAVYGGATMGFVSLGSFCYASQQQHGNNVSLVYDTSRFQCGGNGTEGMVLTIPDPNDSTSGIGVPGDNETDVGLLYCYQQGLCQTDTSTSCSLTVPTYSEMATTGTASTRTDDDVSCVYGVDQAPTLGEMQDWLSTTLKQRRAFNSYVANEMPFYWT